MSLIRTTLTAALDGGATLAGGAAALAAGGDPAPASTSATTAGPTATTAGPTTADTGTDTAADTPPRLGWRWFSRLTAEQKACLDKADLRRPVGPLTDAEREALQAGLRATAQSCDIPVPTGERRAKVRAFWESLSEEQRTCLKEANLTRPLGPLDPKERQQLRTDLAAAAKSCNVALPGRG
jgi:hypothetical protein